MNIPFIPYFGDSEIGCDTEGAVVSLTDLRFYVYDLQLIEPDGSAIDVRLDNDASWQNDRIAMLDFENNLGECLNGTANTNATLRAFVPDADYVTLRFTLGVPFDDNHSDPLKAVAPLNNSAMHWHWRSGYKFLRAGIKTANDGFWFHLGSTGCKGTTGDISGCSAPNRVLVEIADFDPRQDAIAIDLSALITASDLEDGVPTDCSSGPAELNCNSAFNALGIDFSTGRESNSQILFRKSAAF